ncbi:hypothetical protein FEM03_16245 [Phragmitibacter flavus]|uniref:Formylglycine-generating enzyme family protein n=1 Tax=Phragmitibacter flavus TaxID=2576071 RepID=A0A5R8KC44_9BACT|nr:hypothetical protein [Phragmitibacter flavus]TLD69868.1 hypothetical protein FEM03_16245 [Phragmitibacter flavus]
MSLPRAAAVFTFVLAGSLLCQPQAQASPSRVIVRSAYSPSAGIQSGEPAKPSPISGSVAKPRPSVVRPGPLSTVPHSFTPRTGWKQNIVATVFWVGEQPTQNNPTPNCKSSWDTAWMDNFGGYDDPDITNRTHGYRPVNFIPKQNPFYIALPYNDVINHATTKPEAAKVIPWFKETFKRHGKSVCHNRWLAIRHEGRVVYAQWSDCGPFVTDDAPYVFGDAPPVNTSNNGAGIDLSPAVRDYLGFTSGKKVDWCFVEAHEVPDGPWKALGTNNPFSKTWVKDPEPIFQGAFIAKTWVKSKSSTSPSKSRSKKLAANNGLPGFTLKKARKSEG